MLIRDPTTTHQNKTNATPPNKIKPTSLHPPKQNQRHPAEPANHQTQHPPAMPEPRRDLLVPAYPSQSAPVVGRNRAQRQFRQTAQRTRRQPPTSATQVKQPPTHANPRPNHHPPKQNQRHPIRQNKINLTPPNRQTITSNTHPPCRNRVVTSLFRPTPRDQYSRAGLLLWQQIQHLLSIELD